MSPALFFRSLLLVALLAAAALAQPLPQWRTLPVRSQQEFDQRIIGGENTQHMQGVARSQSNPDIIYMSHDVAQLWRSADAGLSWQKCLGRGMHVFAGQSVQVDPADPDHLLAIVDDSSNYLLSSYQGLYRSTNGGQDWTLVRQATSANQRFYQHNIDFDPTSVSSGRAQRWYAAFPGGAIHRSEDGGASFAQAASLAAHTTLYAIHCHPTDTQTVYLCSNAGLYRSTDRGVTFAPLGNLPAGTVSSMAVDPAAPGRLYAVLKDDGLYRSENAGATFTRIKALDALYVFLNPGFPNVIYLVGDGVQSVVSSDSGATWTTVVVTPPPTLDTGWKTSMRGSHTGVVPDPRHPDKAVAFFNAEFWRTDNAGRNWVDSSQGFTGYAWGWWADSLAFDVADPGRFVMFCADVSMIKTENGADWFTRHRVPYDWYTAGLIPWIGTYSGDIQPIAGSGVIVCSAGMYFNNKLIRTTDGGANWTIVRDEIRNYLFVAFHGDDPNLCFTENLRSTDAGATWTPIQFLVDNNAQILGLCRSQPDTLYAMASPRNKLFRSDDRGLTWRQYASVSWTFNRLDSKPTFAVHPTDPNVVYTLNASGDLARFDGTNWTALGVLAAAGGSSPGNNYVRMAAIDPRHPEILYASMATPGRPAIFRSTDAGASWVDISQNLSRCGGLALFVHPHTGDLMVGSAFGTQVFPPPYESPNALYHRLVFDLRVSLWQGLATHGPAGDIATSMADNYIEPRLVGPQHFRLTLSAPADPATLAQPEPPALPSGGLAFQVRPLVDGLGSGSWLDHPATVTDMTWSAGNAELSFTLAAPLPPAHECRISLPATLAALSGWPLVGSPSLTFRQIPGDVDASGHTTAADLLEIRARIRQNVTAATARYDLDTSGQITPADQRAARPLAD